MAEAKSSGDFGGIEAAIAYCSENVTPTIVVIESEKSGDSLLAEIDSLAEVCNVGSNVIVIGTENDVSLYRALLRHGVSDYLTRPVTPAQITEALMAICGDPDAAQLGRMIAFVGARGGTGSSTMAHNVAWSLGDIYEENVALVDLDIPFGTAALAFNIEADNGIVDALAQPERVDEVLLERFMEKYDEHLMLLAAPGSLESNPEITIESLSQVLEKLRRMVAFVVLDMPHGWTPWAQQSLQDSDEVAITTSLDLAGLRDAKNLYTKLTALRGEYPPLRLILNRVGAYKKTELSPKNFEETLKCKTTLEVPFEPALFGTAANNGQMVAEIKARQRVAADLGELAKTLSGRQKVTEKKKKGVLSLFRK